MRKVVWILLAAILLPAGAPLAGAADREDTFTNQSYSYRLWNFCEAEKKMLWFDKSEQDPKSFLRNRINANSPDTSCDKDPDPPDSNCPSLIDPAGDVSKPSSNDDPYQRNELRFADEADWQVPEEAHWYSLRFKAIAADEIPAPESNRWIIAQWKYKKLGPNISPFLAQRFDNGVLHVSVEDGFCRCMIARAGGGPDTTIASGAALSEVAPLRCRWNKLGEPATECKPPKLKLYAYDAKDLEQLPDPNQDWVTMTYHIKAGGQNETFYEIYANGRFIVRARYAYQAKVPPDNLVKFKFGHYRDKKKTTADMLVARVCVSQKVDRCDKSVKPVEASP